jgi:hypothetical protein
MGITEAQGRLQPVPRSHPLLAQEKLRLPA